MKNRAKLLCQKNGIDTPKVYALRVGITEELAKGIWDETAVIPNDVITRSCEIFNCSDAYFLCLCERVN